MSNANEQKNYYKQGCLFRDSHTLLISMNGAKRYGCLSCCKEFSRKFNLQRHWVIVHGETMDEPRSEEEEEEQERITILY